MSVPTSISDVSQKLQSNHLQTPLECIWSVDNRKYHQNDQTVASWSLQSRIKPHAKVINLRNWLIC